MADAATLIAPPRNAEVNLGDVDERGHCKCCCAKWRAVDKPRMQYTMRRTDIPTFWLVFYEDDPCTCGDHAP